MQKRISKVLLTLLVIVILAGSFGTYSLAADEYKNCNAAYGSIIPTDSSLSAPQKSYSFSGDSGVFYFMRISKGKPDAWFSVEIFSDAQYTTQIRSFKDQYSATASRKPLSVTWNFKTISSGTYYGRCYTYYLDGENKIIDTSTLTTFQININRVGKREVVLKTLKNTVNGPKLTWESVPTAIKYNVYRRAEGEKKWSLLKTVGENVTSYVDKTAKSGKTYAYTVKCNDGKYNSLYNKNGLKTYFLAQPKLQPVSGVKAAGSAQIKWNAIAGASGYYVYRTGGSLSSYNWEKIATIKNGKTTTYVDTKATSTDWNYTYTVKAYYGKHTSSYDHIGVNFNYLKAPKITKVGTSEKGMLIQWTADDADITGYYVYRKNGTSWKKIGTTTKKSFVDTTAVSNKTYTYTVKAYTSTNAGAYNSKGVSSKFLSAPNLQSLTFNSKNQGILKWAKVDGAAGYKVYRKVDNAKSWTLIYTIKKGSTTSYTDTVAKNSGSKYAYTVRAFDSKNLHSGYNAAGVSNIFLAKPEFTAAQISTNDNSLAISVNWNKVAGATKYNVYRRVPDGKWKLLANGISELSFTDTTINSGVTYQYAVRACNNGDSISAYLTKDATAISIPTLLNVLIGENGIDVKWTAVENATFKVYRAPVNSEDWIAIATTQETTYTDTTEGATSTSYKYCVTASIKDFESAKSNIITNTTDISAVATFDAETKEIVITWNSPLAVTFNVIKVTGEEEPVNLGDFTVEILNGKIADGVIVEGKEYTYTITAKSPDKVNGVAVVTAKYPYPPLEKVVLNNYAANYNDGAPICTLQWAQVQFASEYVILRSPYESDSYEEVGKVNAADAVDGILTFTDSISEEIAYKYCIKATSAEDRASSDSDETAKIIVYKPLDAIADLVAKDEINLEGKVENAIKVTISWSPIKNAETYIVYRKADDGIFEEKITITVTDNTPNETVFIDEDAVAGVHYTYRVVARAENRDSSSNTVDCFRPLPESN